VSLLPSKSGLSKLFSKINGPVWLRAISGRLSANGVLLVPFCILSRCYSDPDGAVQYKKAFDISIFCYKASKQPPSDPVLETPIQDPFICSGTELGTLTIRTAEL
jgi:hypothetical protein